MADELLGGRLDVSRRRIELGFGRVGAGAPHAGRGGTTGARDMSWLHRGPPARLTCGNHGAAVVLDLRRTRISWRHIGPLARDADPLGPARVLHRSCRGGEASGRNRPRRVSARGRRASRGEIPCDSPGGRPARPPTARPAPSEQPEDGAGFPAAIPMRTRYSGAEDVAQAHASDLRHGGHLTPPPRPRAIAG